MYADDTVIFTFDKSPHEAPRLLSTALDVQGWLADLLMSFF